MNGEALQVGLQGREVDFVLADIPYGWRSSWQTTGEDEQIEVGVAQLLTSLTAVVSPRSIVAIIADKSQKCADDRYERVDRFQIGKRRIFLLQLRA